MLMSGMIYEIKQRMSVGMLKSQGPLGFQHSPRLAGTKNLSFSDNDVSP